jgi:hypothetical protein
MDVRLGEVEGGYYALPIRAGRARFRALGSR